MYYKLKLPVVADVYEGEYPLSYPEMYRIIFKASGKFWDGFIRPDKKVFEYVAQANARNQKFGLYHFMLPNDIQRQFDTLMSVVYKTGIGHMPITLDVECDPYQYGVSRRVFGHQVKTFLDLIETEINCKPIIYTSAYFWTFVDYTGWTPSLYPLWQAVYPKPKTIIDSVHAPYPLPKGWSEWALWQYTDSGRTDGFPLNDYNTVSPKFKSFLDLIWGDGITPPQQDIFPSNIYINDKNYKESVL